MHTHRFIALKTRVFIQRGIHRVHDRGLIGRFLIVRLTHYRWTEVNDFTRRFIHQQDIFVRMRLLLTTVMIPLLGRVLGALPAPLGPVNRHLQ